jgi:hypothetical protein
VIELEDLNCSTQRDASWPIGSSSSSTAYPILFVATLRLASPGEGAALRLHPLGQCVHRVTEIALEPLSADAAARFADRPRRSRAR